VLILHSRIVAATGPDRDKRSLSMISAIPPEPTTSSGLRLRAKGLCDWIGLTGLGDPPALHQVVDSGRFDVAQIYYNLLNPTAMAGAGPGWNTTDFDGLSSGAPPRTWGSWGFACWRPATSPPPSVTGGRYRSPPTPKAGRGAAALRFGLACPLISTIVVGIGETWHLDQPLAAAELGPLPASALDELDDLRRTHPAFRG
jgi:L-galactose dehydrogenase/L-glyceraldehyde 3-phosphate reductase